jgi:predicted NAD/FAD-dependent oxidoreductase
MPPGGLPEPPLAVPGPEGTREVARGLYTRVGPLLQTGSSGTDGKLGLYAGGDWGRGKRAWVPAADRAGGGAPE